MTVQEPEPDPSSPGSEAVGRPPLAVSFRFLLGVYVAVPLTIVLQLLDAAVWGGVLRIAPLDERAPTVWAYVGMGLPHVAVSSVMLATNAEYLRRFRTRVLGTLLFIGAFFAVARQLPYEVAFALLGVTTVVHVFLQQMGIGRAFCRCDERWYAAWTWTSVGVGCLLYNRIYLAEALGSAGRSTFDVAVGGTAAIHAVAVARCLRTTTSARGRAFLWANTAMVLAGVYLHAVGWVFLAVLAPRVVHDLTAFGFYAVHDHNRHGPKPRNAVFAVTRRLGIPAVCVAPLLGILLTGAVHRWAEPALGGAVRVVTGRTPAEPIAIYLVVALMLLHYSTEAVTWRRGSPYREFVPVA